MFAHYLHPTYGKLQVPFNDFPGRDTGVILGGKPTDYVAGKVGGLAHENLIPNFDWRGFTVKPEKQYFNTFDSLGCTGFANNNAAEVSLKFRTGYEFNFSDEGINSLAGNTQQGNTVVAPAEWARKNGRILQEAWTVLDPKTWQDFHKPVPLEVQKTAIKFDEKYEWVDTSRPSLEFHLKHAPLIIVIKAGSWLHAVVLLHINNEGLWYLDTYPGTDNFIKITNQYPTHALKLIVKPMSNSIFVKKAGTQEYGFFLPATSEESLKDKALNLGKKELFKPDGTIDFAQAKEISGL